MKRKLKHWLVTLDNGEFTTADTIIAFVLTRVPNSNTILADGVEIRFGSNVTDVEEVK